MHSIRPRPICRAHNTFSPAIALWQHFVVPNQQLTRRPLKSSFATEAAQAGSDEAERPGHEDPPADYNAIPIGQGGGTLVRKSNRTPGSVVQRDPHVRRVGRFVDVRTRALTGEKPHNVLAHANKLLKTAYDAYDASEDYEGVAVLPMDLPVGVQDYQLPWAIQGHNDLSPSQK